MTRVRPSFVELFCGAGGLSLGLRHAGWRPVLAIDHWSDAINTYELNFGDGKALCDDIASLTESRLGRLLSKSPEWVVGGPPCQGFSTVGKRERDDPRNQLVRQFAQVVQVLQPRRFLVENVIGLRDMLFVDHVCRLFFRMGYQVTPVVVTAADYGVPQLRRRILFVGDREGGTFRKPDPHRQPSEYVSVWDAIGDLPALEPGEKTEAYDRAPSTDYQKQMRRDSKILQGHEASHHPTYLVRAISFIPDGGNRSHIPPRYQPRSGYHNSYSRLHSVSPAVAVTQNMGKPSGTRCIHPFQDRGLTAREGARLQGFPDTFHFTGGMMSQRLQIANAVPPILAETMGRVLLKRSHWTNSPLERDSCEKVLSARSSSRSSAA